MPADSGSMKTSDDDRAISTPHREPPGRRKTPAERRHWAERFRHLCQLNPERPKITLAARIATGAQVNASTVIAWAKQADDTNVGSKAMTTQRHRRDSPGH